VFFEHFIKVFYARNILVWVKILDKWYWKCCFKKTFDAIDDKRGTQSDSDHFVLTWDCNATVFLTKLKKIFTDIQLEKINLLRIVMKGNYCFVETHQALTF
jgi:hypothetical protein